MRFLLSRTRSLGSDLPGRFCMTYGHAANLLLHSHFTYVTIIAQNCDLVKLRGDAIRTIPEESKFIIVEPDVDFINIRLDKSDTPWYNLFRNSVFVE